ncbi:MAG TPA: hypothetical protein VFV36_09005 [Candidatus Methylomirabilis sp.]|nr:hypothetical protein [Candidatus Methylomirabilis sp.]
MPPIATLRETVPPAAAREALLWERRLDASVVCNLCAHRCRIRPGCGTPIAGVWV